MLQEIKVPQVAESIRQVTIAEWHKSDGTWVETDEVLCSFETEKATMDLVAEHSGQLKISAKEGHVVDVGGVIGMIDTSVSKPAAAPPPPSPQKFPPKAPKLDSPTAPAQGHPSPAAAHLMAKNNLGAHQVPASGKDGRITHQDVQTALQAPPSPASSPQPASTIAIAPSPTGDGTVRREKMSTLRRKLAQRLVSMKNQTAMTTTFNEVDMGEVQALRERHKQSFQDKHGVRLGLLPFFMKAASQALSEFPIINASVDGDEIVFHERHDFSIAVNSPKGLLVPVVRNVNQLTFAQIEQSIADLALRGRSGKLTLEEMSGGTFSITNGGVFGSMLSTPLLNPPQSAILGLHNIVDRPVARNNQVVIRPVMYVALSYDHRIIDGRDSVSFLVRIKKLLEEPSQMLIGV